MEVNILSAVGCIDGIWQEFIRPGVVGFAWNVQSDEQIINQIRRFFAQKGKLLDEMRKLGSRRGKWSSFGANWQILLQNAHFFARIRKRLARMRMNFNQIRRGVKMGIWKRSKTFENVWKLV